MIFLTRTSIENGTAASACSGISGSWGTACNVQAMVFGNLDDRSGWGPENINIEDPADGDYEIRVHYFEDYGSDATTATVKVWLDGALHWEGHGKNGEVQCYAHIMGDDEILQDDVVLVIP